MRRNQKQPNPKSTLITGIILSIVLLPILFIIMRGDDNIPLIFAPMLSAICITFFIYTYRREKKADIKAETEKSDFLDDSYFRSSEWREKYLRYIQANNFEKPDENGMKSDLTAKYRQMASLLSALLGPLILLWTLWQIHAGQLTVFGFFFFMLPSLFFMYLTYQTLEKYFAVPVKKLYKRRDIAISDVEDSYDNGKLLTYKKCGINIGTAFLVIYNEKNVDVIKFSDIQSVTRHITRLKKYDGTLYAGEEYLHKARITADKDYLIELDEFQVEMVINELRAYTAVQTSAEISEDHNNQIVT